MSRANVRNESYSLSFGVDHTPMGCFFQLYETAAIGEDPEGDEIEQPQVEADEMYGLRIHNRRTLERNLTLRRVIDAFARHNLTLRNEEIIIDIGKACGLDVSKQVFELWD